MKNKKFFANLSRIFIFTSGCVCYYILVRILYNQVNKEEVTYLHSMVKKLSHFILKCATAIINSGFIGLSEEKNLDKLNHVKQLGKSLSDVDLKLKTDQNGEDKGVSEHFKDLLSEIDDFADFVPNEDLNNKLVSGFYKFYQYLDSLTLLQELSLLHVLMFCVLIITVIYILSVLFGNEIIRFFGLEKRFPKLSTFFSLRVIFQRYYLMWNVLILIVFSLFCIAINILIFTST